MSSAKKLFGRVVHVSEEIFSSKGDLELKIRINSDWQPPGRHHVDMDALWDKFVTSPLPKRHAFARVVTEAMATQPPGRQPDSQATADERQPEPPTAEPDVPEWQKQIAIRIRDRIRATGCWSAEFVEQVVREECDPLESEIARRVKEATAQMNGLIRERDVLCQQLAERDAECKRASKELKRSFKIGIDLQDSLEERNKQLAAAQVERDSAYEAAKVNKAEVERLKAELAEARKPVEGVDWRKAATTCIGYASQTEWYRVVTEPLLQRERNARLAAERERDELRDIVECVDGQAGNSTIDRHCLSPQLRDRIDAVLAAFRARQEGVKSNG